jgi:dimethylamine monooxygenase subunit A
MGTARRLFCVSAARTRLARRQAARVALRWHTGSMSLAFDFEAAVQAPFRMQPGLQRMATSAKHLHPLRAGSRHQREKLAVLFSRTSLALVRSPNFDAEPALDALCHLAQAEHPAHVVWDGVRLAAPQLGVAVHAAEVITLGQGVFGLGDEVPRCLQSLPAAWRRAGLLALAFAEDIAIVDGRTATVPWMAVALPSRWDPRDKVGQHFANIHSPVADSDTLRRAGEHLLRLVCGPERWERFVWNITGHPRLNAHPDSVDPKPWGHDLPATSLPPAWFRSERQTFVPLPSLTQAVFTIAVDCVPLTQAVRSAAHASRLHDAVASMSPAVLAYRGLTPVREPLLAWLAQQAGERASLSAP